MRLHPVSLSLAMGWDRLEREIEAWVATGRPATFWWRDDDAVGATPALARLLRLSEGHGIPISLAVIPASAEPGLARAIAGREGVTILQHGYAHKNHAAAGMRAVECGGDRPPDEIEIELALGRDRLTALFGHSFLRVLVPPWNRIEPALLPRLPALGFTGLSTWVTGEGRATVPGLRQVDTHADLIAWRKDRSFRGAERVIQALFAHLQARREGRADRDEPTGLLTHHLVHDEAGWTFLDELSERLAPRTGVRWIGAAEAFGAAQ